MKLKLLNGTAWRSPVDSFIRVGQEIRKLYIEICWPLQ